jgi:outer membrane protein assembly factor BamD
MKDRFVSIRISGRRSAAAVLALVSLVAAVGCRHRKYENPITKDTQQPDKVLFDKSIKDIEKGRYEVARLTLNTLMNTYDTSEYLAKAKLAIADSWMREGGSHGLAQAEAEYKDFILFYPTMEESPEAQMKVCDIHFRQMEKPDRDPAQVLRAEEECREVLTKFPNSRFAPEAANRLRQVQEVYSEGEFRVGDYYHHKGNFPAAANRLQNVSDHYPLYSGSDQALWELGDSYGRMGPRFRQRAVSSYQKILRDYPLSALAEDAKKKLKDLEAEIPEADPVAYARQKYEIENVTKPGMVNRSMSFVRSAPDVSRAAKSGAPVMTSLRPTAPYSVPSMAATLGTPGVNDVSASTVGATNDQLDTKPDARASHQEGATPAEGSAPADPNAPAAPAAADAKPAADDASKASQESSKDSKKKKKKKDKDADKKDKQ